MKKKLIVAVSGGIDSVVLLHKLVQEQTYELVVAHFDHGIRPESDADARFVQALARQYSLPFEQTRENLGEKASEALAREQRYAFLRSVAQKYNDAPIATAHHGDDIVETIAINFLRGTGWRGLAVLDSDTLRPLLYISKRDIREYALVNRLEWVEDETNAGYAYLRNRVRARIALSLPEESKTVLASLRTQQVTLKQLINKEINHILGSSSEYSRYLFTHIDDDSALELLREILLRYRLSLTRPQRHRVLHAIKVAKPGSRIEAGEGAVISFKQTVFVVETLPSVV